MSLRYPPVPVSPLLFLDYDGTLAPIVDDPMQAFPHPEVPDLLRELDKKYPLWIVTGRNLNDLSVLLGVPLQGIGLHGAQEGRIGGPTEYLVNADAIRGLHEMMPYEMPSKRGLLEYRTSWRQSGERWLSS